MRKKFGGARKGGDIIVHSMYYDISPFPGCLRDCKSKSANFNRVRLQLEEISALGLEILVVSDIMAKMSVHTVRYFKIINSNVYNVR